ncbi:probable glutathione S-transferase isoform X1 [Aristolochia californica]|uniref:probable glutathione S-transferase isoform X1 n=1 Tax=Aristolochia californica TaxID=171875 RepID=UPI0035E32762
MAGGVKLIGAWTSSYTHRVQLALKLKGVEFEYMEEDLRNKSPLLLLHNPVYKKVPVLLHGEDAVAESTVILEYIDETWKQDPIMTANPYERAKVRFWSHFADDKLGPAVGEVFRLRGEEQKSALDQVNHNLKMLEEELAQGFFKGRKFFGGEKIGFLDIVIGCGSSWLWVFEEVVGVKLVDAEAFPRFFSWLRDFEEQPEVKETIPPADKLLEYAKGLHQMISVATVEEITTSKRV